MIKEVDKMEDEIDRKLYLDVKHVYSCLKVIIVLLLIMICFLAFLSGKVSALEQKFVWNGENMYKGNYKVFDIDWLNNECFSNNKARKLNCGLWIARIHNMGETI